MIYQYIIMSTKSNKKKKLSKVLVLNMDSKLDQQLYKSYFTMIWNFLGEGVKRICHQFNIANALSWGTQKRFFLFFLKKGHVQRKIPLLFIISMQIKNI